MLKETIYSSLFILASKRNRVRVGYEKDWFCARLLFQAPNCALTEIFLTGTNIPPFPPTRFILEPLVVSQCLLLMQYIKSPLSGANPALG